MGAGGGLHTRRFEIFRNISSGKKIKNKKILVLTLSSPSEKGRKKNPGINPGHSVGKGQEKKRKKTY